MTRCRDEMGAVSLMAANCQVSEARIDFFRVTHLHICTHTHTIHPLAHSTEPGLEDGHGSIQFYFHDGGTDCPGRARSAQKARVCCWRRHTRVRHGTMAPSWHPLHMLLGLPQLPWGPLATLIIWQRSTPCPGALIAADRIPYIRTSSALILLLSTEQVTYTRFYGHRVWTLRLSYNHRLAAAARDRARRRAAKDGWLRPGPRHAEAVQTTNMPSS